MNRLIENCLEVTVEKNVSRYFSFMVLMNAAKETMKQTSSVPSRIQRKLDENFTAASSLSGAREDKYIATKLVVCPSTRHTIQYNPPHSYGSEKERGEVR